MTARKEKNRPAFKSAKATKPKKLRDRNVASADADDTAPKQRRDEVLAKHAFNSPPFAALGAPRRSLRSLGVFLFFLPAGR